MENLLSNEHERVDNLHLDGYKLIQNSKHFRYGMDAVILSWYVGQRVNKHSQIIDFGTGTGILPILLAANQCGNHIDAIEIQEYFADLAKRNVQLNGLSQFIHVIEGDIRNLPQIVAKNRYDVVISNPPYMSGSILNEDLAHAIARHEITWSMEGFMSAAKKILKDKGKLILIHRPSRLVDLFTHMRMNHIEPKSIRFISPKVSKEPNLVLVEGLKNGKSQLTIEKPLVVYHENGEYTDELKKIYGIL